MSVHGHRFLDTTWFWTSFAYRDEQSAERAYRRLAAVGRAQRGKLELGFYRHGSSVSGMVLVSALGLRREGVERASKVLEVGGLENDVPALDLEALIARRVRVVSELYAQEAPAQTWERRRAHGVNLNPDGTINEGEAQC